MARRCEVCASLLAMGYALPAGCGRVRLLLVGDRVVALCDEHADEVLSAGLDSLSEVRRRFVEPAGHRSLLPRRAPLDRRMFPPRPEGRRLGAGRREGERAE